MFFRYWRIELAAYVVSAKDIHNERDECYQAKLTMSGVKKMMPIMMSSWANASALDECETKFLCWHQPREPQ